MATTTTNNNNTGNNTRRLVIITRTTTTTTNSTTTTKSTTMLLSELVLLTEKLRLVGWCEDGGVPGGGVHLRRQLGIAFGQQRPGEVALIEEPTQQHPQQEPVLAPQPIAPKTHHITLVSVRLAFSESFLGISEQTLKIFGGFDRI